MKQFKYLIVVFLSVLTIHAQEKLEKLSQSVKVNKDVTLNLDTSYTNIEIDTWNKNEVKIEAYIESNELTKEELQEVLENWKVKLEGSGANVSITSSGGIGSSWDFNFNFDGDALDALKDLQFVIADIPEMPEMDFVIPEIDFIMADMPKMPEMPELPELPEGVNKIDFDIEKYKDEGEAYLEKWGQEYENKYGAEYKDKMKAWAKKFSKTDFDKYSKKMEVWGKKFEKDFGKYFEIKMKVWAKKMDGKWAKNMEAWGEKFEIQMEARTKVLEERLKAKEVRIQERKKIIVKRITALVKRKVHLKNRSEFSKNAKIIKTIKIRIPKDTKLKINVRHGELKFSAVIYNLKAKLSHATLFAEKIDGSNTSINASYSPVLVTNWNLGELNLNHVDNAQLKKVKHLTLNSNSSNVVIGELTGNAVINGSFGDLEIAKISNSFHTLNLILENSDAVITLPKTDFNLQYKGVRSSFEHPNKKNKENTSTFSTGSLSSNKTIVINAKYSNVVMQ